MFPYGYGSGSVELSQCQLHVEEWNTTKDGHQNIGNKESTCTEMHEGTSCYVGVLHGRHDDDENSTMRSEEDLNLNLKTKLE